MTIPRDSGIPDYAYKSGMLEAFIHGLAMHNLPGIDFPSGKERLEFNTFLEREIVRIHNQAVRYQNVS